MNKFVVSLSVAIIIGLIMGVTSYKVVTRHNKKLLLVDSKYIVEKAKDCYNQKKCTDNKVTLKELYDLNFLEKQVNKITKEYYNENSYIEVNDNEYKFIVKE